MSGIEYAVALVIPAASTRPLRWWTDQAAANLRHIVEMDGRHVHGLPRYHVKHGQVAMVTAACSTRPGRAEVPR